MLHHGVQRITMSDIHYKYKPDQCQLKTVKNEGGLVKTQKIQISEIFSHSFKSYICLISVKMQILIFKRVKGSKQSKLPEKESESIRSVFRCESKGRRWHSNEEPSTPTRETLAYAQHTESCPSRYTTVHPALYPASPKQHDFICRTVSSLLMAFSKLSDVSGTVQTRI